MNNREILNYVLEITDLKTFNTAVKKNNVQLIYENKKNHLIYNLFEGNVLKFATKMADVFNEFQTTENALLSLDLEEKINKLKFSISYDRRNSALIMEHNLLVKKFKDVNKGLNDMVKIYRKIKRNQINGNQKSKL